MLLQLAHPEVSARTCDACLRWIFDTDSGNLVRNRETGEPLPRPPGSRTPCLTCPKCTNTEEKTPEAGRRSDVSRRNQLTLLRYHEQLVTPGPVDDVMRRNFGIIHEVLDTYDRGVRRAALMLTKVR